MQGEIQYEGGVPSVPGVGISRNRYATVLSAESTIFDSLRRAFGTLPGFIHREYLLSRKMQSFSQAITTTTKSINNYNPSESKNNTD